jgi:hypothetical protein
MRTYTVRLKQRKLTREQEKAWRKRMITAINQAHGYSLDSLKAMDTKKLVSLRNRIGNRMEPTHGRLAVDRHRAKLTA